MTKLNVGLVLLVVFVLYPFSAHAKPYFGVGTILEVRPNEIIPEAPPGALWHVTSKKFEKIKTEDGAPTNITVPFLDVELVKQDRRLVGDLLESPEVGGYLSGSRPGLSYALELTSDRNLIVQIYNHFGFSAERVFEVGKTWWLATHESELPLLEAGYFWKRQSPLFLEHLDVVVGKTTYILAKSDPDVPDSYSDEEVYSGLLARDAEEIQRVANCVSGLSIFTMTSTRH